MQKILIVDHERCTGCRLCELVCSVKNAGVSNPSRARIHIIKWEMEGFELPMVCPQCEPAPCMAVCPVDALSRDGDLERVVIDYDLCIGCKLCVAACPFGGMGIDAVAKKVIKCELCDGDPTCVDFCQPQALQYVPAGTVNLRKKREAGLRFSELVRRFAGV